MKQLAGCSAVITGAASGIGRVIALSLAREGVNVAVADLDADLAAETARSVRDLGVNGISVQTDVSRRESVEALADRAYQEFGSVEILVNNAGVTLRPFRAIWDASAKDFEWIMGVNYWGVVHGMQVFIPRMRSHPGDKHIVNTSSGATFLAPGGNAAYTASKMAVEGLSMCAREECALLGIGVSVLFPNTKFASRIPTSERLRPEEDRSGERDIPLWTSYGGQSSDPNPLDDGLPPDEIGPMVVRGIRENEPYIMTNPPSERFQQRVDAILQAGNRPGF
jgi:NAD(P)-dependent dehydrogenase (short-subunit alcohol dehydrogenase family)